MRSCIIDISKFLSSARNVIWSNRVIRIMDDNFPQAQPEDLLRTDNVCIICREEMLAPSTKKLPCNHIFHKTCLRSWFQRQQTCPTCRLDVLRAPLPNQANARVAGLAAAVAAAAQRGPQPGAREQGHQQVGGQAAPP